MSRFQSRTKPSPFLAAPRRCVACGCGRNEAAGGRSPASRGTVVCCVFDGCGCVTVDKGVEACCAADPGGSVSGPLPPLRGRASLSSGDAFARTAVSGQRCGGQGREGSRGRRMARNVVADAPPWGGRGKGRGDRRRGTRSRETAAAGGAALLRPRPPSTTGRGSRDPSRRARLGTIPQGTSPRTLSRGGGGRAPSKSRWYGGRASPLTRRHWRSEMETAVDQSRRGNGLGLPLPSRHRRGEEGTAAILRDRHAE